MYFDYTYILVLIALGLGLLAQGAVKSAYSRYAKVGTQRGVPAAAVAQDILRQNGNDVVTIQPVAGQLTDHYDPRKETLGLSEGVYGSASVAALGIAAHEVGHAMQKKEGYAPLKLRSALVPVVSIGSNLSMPIVILGLVMSIRPLITVGIVLFALAVLFALITLPVEFDASRRAVAMLNQGGHITQEEEKGVRKVLNAAALTYVAAALGAVLQLVRLLILSRSGSRRR